MNQAASGIHSMWILILVEPVKELATLFSASITVAMRILSSTKLAGANSWKNSFTYRGLLAGRMRTGIGSMTSPNLTEKDPMRSGSKKTLLFVVKILICLGFSKLVLVLLPLETDQCIQFFGSV